MRNAYAHGPYTLRNSTFSNVVWKAEFHARPHTHARECRTIFAVSRVVYAAFLLVLVTIPLVRTVRITRSRASDTTFPLVSTTRRGGGGGCRIFVYPWMLF